MAPAPVNVILFVRQEGAIGQFWTKGFQVPDGTPLEVLASARQQCYAEKLEVGGVDTVIRDPATVPAILPGETVLQEGNPDIQGVVIRVGRSTGSSGWPGGAGGWWWSRGPSGSNRQTA